MSEMMRNPEPFPWLCGQCGAEKVFPEKIAYETTLRYEGRDYQVVAAKLPALECRECGAVLLNNESDAHLSAAFRERLRLLQPETIREGRKRLGLNQREFAELLGVAEESVSRWETGAQMQSRVVDKIMRVYFASPEARKVLDAARTDATVGISSDCSEYGPANERKGTSNGSEQITAEEQRPAEPLTPCAAPEARREQGRQPKPFPHLCPECGATAVYGETTDYKTAFKYEGHLHEFEVQNITLNKCRDCGGVILPNTALDQIAEAFRRHARLLTAQQIRDDVEKLQFTQKDFAELLGVAPETVSRWLTNVQIQTRSLDRLMRLLFKSADVRRDLADMNRGAPTQDAGKGP